MKPTASDLMALPEEEFRAFVKGKGLSLRPLSEAEFQRQVLDLVRIFGWRCYHPFLSKWSEKGFPDLTLVRPPRLVFAELKAERDKVSPAQEEWLHLLEGTAASEVYVWRPSDIETVAAVLR